MTTPADKSNESNDNTALTEGQQGDDLEGRTPTDHILTGQEGDEVVDPAEVEEAMAAGWKKAGGKADDAATDKDVTTQPDKKPGDKEGDETGIEQAATDTDKGATTQQPNDEDPEIPGLGMKASQVRSSLQELETLKKTSASLAGSLGHLKQLVTKAGEGKKVTKEALARVSEEFGPEFADALAADLSAAGFGAGATVDVSAVQAMVSEQVARVSEENRRTLEKRAVMRAHKDADDHFARPKVDDSGKPVLVKDANGNDVQAWEAGPKHAAFMQFIGTLPKDRQKELQENGWDSDVIIRALDDFKSHEKKAATTQATQTARVSRAVAPTAGSGRGVEQPAEDPMLQGWNKVRGNARSGRATQASRR